MAGGTAAGATMRSGAASRLRRRIRPPDSRCRVSNPAAVAAQGSGTLKPACVCRSRERVRAADRPAGANPEAGFAATRQPLDDRPRRQRAGGGTPDSWFAFTGHPIRSVASIATELSFVAPVSRRAFGHAQPGASCFPPSPPGTAHDQSGKRHHAHWPAPPTRIPARPSRGDRAAPRAAPVSRARHRTRSAATGRAARSSRIR